MTGTTETKLDVEIAETQEDLARARDRLNRASSYGMSQHREEVRKLQTKLQTLKEAREKPAVKDHSTVAYDIDDAAVDALMERTADAALAKRSSAFVVSWADLDAAPDFAGLKERLDEGCVVRDTAELRLERIRAAVAKIIDEDVIEVVLRRVDGTHLDLEATVADAPTPYDRAKVDELLDYLASVQQGMDMASFVREARRKAEAIREPIFKTSRKG